MTTRAQHPTILDYVILTDDCRCRRSADGVKVMRAMRGAKCFKCGNTGYIKRYQRRAKCLGGPLEGQLAIQEDAVTIGYRLFEHGSYKLWIHESLLQIDSGSDACQVCHGTRGGAPGNENIVNGVVMCDYCHAETVNSLNG